MNQPALIYESLPGQITKGKHCEERAQAELKSNESKLIQALDAKSALSLEAAEKRIKEAQTKVNIGADGSDLYGLSPNDIRDIMRGRNDNLYSELQLAIDNKIQIQDQLEMNKKASFTKFYDLLYNACMEE
jgi:hypothetical protein